MITIREGQLEDVDACLSLDGSFPSDRVLVVDPRGSPPELDIALRWQQIKPAGSRRRHFYGRDEFLSEIEKAERFWVAEVDGAVAGCALLRGIDWHPTTGDIVFIYVDLARRGEGVGTALVEAMQAQARDQSLRGIFWEAQTDNFQAIKFALSHGFAVAGLNLAFYSNEDFARQRAEDSRGIAIFLYWPNES
jgi:N-acetylglutamate synthase-like GNAT family acetyltransferase